MIKSLRLVNFQAHTDTTVHFSDKVNAITGSTDKGKSSIIRAISLVLYNKPSGISYIRHGSKEAKITMTLCSGDTIERVRSKSKNEYVLNGKKLKAMGTSVPQEITALIDMQSMNIQGQHDSPFLLSESAGEVGKRLNQYVDLTAIDRTLANLNSSKRESDTSLRHIEEEIKESSDKLEEHKNTNRLLDEIIGIENINNKLEGVKDKKEKVLDILESIEKLSTSINKEEKMRDTLNIIDKLVKTVEKVADIKEKQRELKNKMDSVVDIQTLVTSLNKKEKLLAKIVPYFYVPEKIDELKKEHIKSAQWCKDVKKELDNKIETVNRIKELEDKKKELDKKLENAIGDTCPLCGSGMEDKQCKI